MVDLVNPDWSRPDPTKNKIYDVNSMREDMWYTFIASFLAAGYLVPGWDLYASRWFQKEGQVWTQREHYYRHKTLGVEVRVQTRFENETTMKIVYTRVMIDRKLGDDWSDFYQTNNSRGTYTVNATTNVIESIDWNA